MGISERKEREKAEMRRRIVDAAIKMFVEEGYEKVSIRKIADEIEYSPATLYLYYKDKDELLYDVQREAFDYLAASFREKVTAKDPFKRLEQLGMAYTQFSYDHPEMYDLMFIIKAPMNTVEEEESWKNGEDAFSFLEQTVAACIKQKLIRFKDPMMASLSIWSFVHGLVSLNLRCRIKVSQLAEDQVRPFTEAAVKEYLRMIKAPSA
ncbi:TetR/AcrR family transcriptional regulator [Chitinophaga vietnamensis]|uniref:TetR/AcrR family transcriptional regulator n=1 Tax=Chitinophaga vietnamensis TaxID=2593957 RepID=UPI0011778CFF|nr:TetR/AcrR family transcriptional regulator [Chitinophaga vietnamensis]